MITVFVKCMKSPRFWVGAVVSAFGVAILQPSSPWYLCIPGYILVGYGFRMASIFSGEAL